MTSVPAQLILDLPQRAALEAEDFLISGSNRAAADIVDRWPDWPHASVIVVAPPRAGKTHLANVWRLKSGAARLDAASVCEADVAKARGALLVEDLHAGIGDERVLFHLLNLVREHKLSMLLTSRAPPGELPVSLPDLRSRLRALSIDNGNGPVEPNVANVLNGTYAPLSRPLFIYVNAAALRRPQVTQFVQYYVNNSAALSQRVGYVPLPANAYQAYLQRVQGRQVGTAFGGRQAIGITIEQLLARRLVMTPTTSD